MGFLKPTPFSRGEPSSRALSCACSRLMVPARTRARAALAMGMTWAPASTRARAGGSWWPR
jgi:hypothetical protein